MLCEQPFEDVVSLVRLRPTVVTDCGVFDTTQFGIVTCLCQGRDHFAIAGDRYCVVGLTDFGFSKR
jgi:hypothetical protein